MRRLSFPAFFLILCAITSQAQPSTSLTCAELHLVPAVRECTAVVTLSVGTLGVAVSPPKNAGDAFAALDLEETLKSRGLHRASAHVARIELLRADEPAARAFLKAHDLAFTPAMHDEGLCAGASRRELSCCDC